MFSSKYLLTLNFKQQKSFKILSTKFSKFNQDSLLRFFIATDVKTLTSICRKTSQHIDNVNVLTFEDLYAIYLKLEQRKLRLRTEGKSLSIIDLTYFECFLRKPEADMKYDAYCKRKTAGCMQYIKDNPEILRNVSLDYQIKHFGEIEGKIRFDKFVQTQKNKSKRSIHYWLLQGQDEETAIKSVSLAQSTFSLEKCIQKYGLKAGHEVWKIRQESWQGTINSKTKEEIDLINSLKGITLENMQRKWGSKLGEAKYNLWLESCGHTLEFYQLKFGNDIGKEKYEITRNSIIGSLNLKASKESIKFFIKLYKWLRKNRISSRNDIYWGIGGSKEFWLNDKSISDKFRFYDFTIKNLKIMIEYNGVAWHAREGDIPWKSAMGCSYKESISNDDEKMKLANSKGFDLYYVWSDDVKEQSLEKLKTLIKTKLNV